MNLTILGSGNIGLTTALCFAQKGHKVRCFDIDQKKIDNLSRGLSTIFEPSLDNLLHAQLKEKNIEFSADLAKALQDSEILFVAVGTPNTETGQIDIGAVENAITEVSKLTTTEKTIIIKSTVPPQTTLRLSKKHPHFRFISSPEFLREGTAISDCLNPDRILIGSVHAENIERDLTLFNEIYKNFGLASQRFVTIDSTTAELTKYASNVFLASRISLINEFSRVCEKTGADIEKLQQALGLDPRIGANYLKAGLGYGGSCLPKDTLALLKFADSLDENLLMTHSIIETNELQIKIFAEKIIDYFNTLNEKVTSPAVRVTANPTICIWGTAFKPDTDDLREAPALKLIQYLRAQNFKLHLYDPKATTQLQNLFQVDSCVRIFTDSYHALQNTEALVICTEWSEFKTTDLTKIKTLLNKPVLFDGRNLFDSFQMRKLGFKYFSVGRN